MESVYFNFHDMVGICIRTGCMNALIFFKSQYKIYTVDSPPDHLPCVYLNFNRFRMPSYRSKGYTRHTHKFFASFDYKIRFTDRHIHRISIPIVHHLLLHSCLRYLVSTCHGTMLHASAVFKEGRSILFTGPSGHGKTTSAAMIVSRSRNNWQFYSDDYVVCVSDSQSLSYDTPLHFYQNLIRCLPELGQRLTIWELLKIHLFGCIRQLTRQKIKWPVRVDSDRLWRTGTQDKKSTPVALMLMFPSATGQFKASFVKPDARMIKKLSDMNFHEVKEFLFLVQKSKIISDFNTWKNDWHNRETKNLTHMIKGIKIYRIECPWKNNRIDGNTSKLFFQFLEDTVSL